jgi:RHS repeat-associated protein
VDDKGKVQQATNYYPFGVPYTDVSVETSPDFQPYKYNDKELDKMYGLNTYDYGARQYNPVTGRWDRIDPLAEKFYPYSPYVYCMDNPVKYIDPDGRRVVNGKGINVFYINSSNVLCVSKYASSNERMVFNGMMLTSTGQKMLRQMIKSKTSIRLKFKARCADAVGRVTYAETQQWGTGNDLGIIKDKNGKFRLKYATIIFYMETIKESLEKENNDNYGLTLTEAMGAEATHESVHASDEEEVDKDIASSNGGEYRSIDDSERKPNQMEQQFRNELKQKKENDE